MATRPRMLGARSKAERSRLYEAERRKAKPWRAWYGTPEWRAIRRAVLIDQPLCERHLRRGEIVAATVVNHRMPHRGDWLLFVEGPFEAVCKGCHDGIIQREERAEARARARAGAARHGVRRTELG